MPNQTPRTHRRSGDDTVCGRGGRNPRLTDEPSKVTCEYCSQGVRGISGHPRPPQSRWHDGWTFVGRDGDGNLILRYEPSGGLYKVLPVEEC